MTPRTILVALLFVCSLGCARADLRDLLNLREMRQFKFAGTVTQSLPIAPADGKVTGAFSYGVSADPGYLTGQWFVPGYGKASYQFPTTFMLKVNGLTVTSSHVTVDVSNNMGVNMDDMLVIGAGYPMVLDGTALSDGYMSLSLATGSSRMLVFLSTDLPRWISPKVFNAWAYGTVQQDGGPNGTLVQFSLDSVELAS